MCPDDGDLRGPVCVTRLESGERFDVISAPGGDFPAPERATKYMVPVDPGDPELLPPLFQNVNRYGVHITFLKAVFPDKFGDLDEQGYMDLVLTRRTRRYFSGNLFRFVHPDEGVFYGFTVYTASRSEELLEAEEVLGIYRMLLGVFDAGKLTYTFDLFDAMAREKARGWSDPGFPIYFPNEQGGGT